MPATTTKAILSAFYMVYYAIMMVMVLFSAVVVFLPYSGAFQGDDPEFAIVLKYVIYGLMPAGIVAGHFIYRQQLSTIAPTLTLRDKLSKLQVAILVRSACLEVAGLFGAVAAFITGDLSFLLFTGIIVAFFLVWRPTVATITEDLQLSGDERMRLEDPKGEIV